MAGWRPGALPRPGNSAGRTASGANGKPDRRSRSVMTFLDCWTEIATTLFAQALAGEPELVESFPKPLESGCFGFSATLHGAETGRFSITLEAAVLASPLLGEGVVQTAGWNELLREVCEAA